MYTLTNHIPNSGSKLPVHEFLNLYNGLQWGKARRINETSFGIVQLPVSCKDYVVDTFYRSSYGFNPDLWTTEERYSPLIYIVFKTKDRKDHFLKMVAEQLNPWELKQGVKPCEVFEVTCEPLTDYWTTVIEYDKCWMNNATAMSIYYSILRICTANDKLSFKQSDKLKWSCNEFSYYRSSHTWAHKVLDDLFVDITPYLVIPEEPYKAHGYKLSPSHGQTGMFYMLGQISYYRMNIPTNMRASNIFYQYIYKKYLDIPDVAKKAPEPRRRNLLGQYV